ncbi:hypothetical protein P2H44_23485 [Albimonas sp. CAU 1670]|uniref:hypothetical protein n=1 Tax=Albimonas sp. CAU 1670 TaxID=3032599 RepID=UPI0023DBB5EC|nr:hypothetical protein [Albimonas sp. CAU 1670]MDF2235529.1 hypothetical protein [Albimonas sp. CAU 1670]
MKLIATTVAALGLMAAPLAAQEAAAPKVRTAGVAQQAELGASPLLGVPPLVIGLVGAVVVVGAAVAISNSNDNNSTPSTK